MQVVIVEQHWKAKARNVEEETRQYCFINVSEAVLFVQGAMCNFKKESCSQNMHLMYVETVYFIRYEVIICWAIIPGKAHLQILKIKFNVQYHITP